MADATIIEAGKARQGRGVGGGAGKGLRRMRIGRARSRRAWRGSPWIRAAALLLSAGGLVAGEADRLVAQEESDGGWHASTEFSFVRTGGNSELSTLGIGTTVTRSWERTEIRIQTGGIRTRTTRRTRTAIGAEDDYRIHEETNTELSAENYEGELRLDRTVSERTSIFAQSGWTRDTFAGIQNRFVNVLGVSTRWISGSARRLRTAYGFTHTVQRDVVPDADGTKRFVGLRVSTEYRSRLNDDVEWSSNLVMDGNGDDTSDLRAEWTNAVSVAMNEHLALKTSLRGTFDNEPALRRLPLRTSLGGEKTGEILVPRAKLDRVLTLTLVVTIP